MTDPLLTKLANVHNIHLGDTLWFYTGYGHNWLYSKQHCIEINNAFDAYAEAGPVGNALLEIQISYHGITTIYVIDFSNMVQYPKNEPHKTRNIGMFQLQSSSDFSRYRIVGVAGTRF